MARTVADINRACTPMHYIEESLEDTREQLREKKRQLETAQKTKSPFLIGSIEEVNRRISNLDQKLQSYTELVIESRASERSHDIYIPPPSAKAREIHQKKEKENREVNQFAGIFAIKSTFLSKPSERVKHISKITMNSSKTAVKKDTGKPKFVELHQYPGYDANELTPLPHDTTATEVLTKVAGAQPHLKQKTQYLPEFERLFYSEMSQAMLQDIFWWLFLDKWQPSSEFQQKLFNRVAHNYVKLITYAKHPQYRETFLRDYPSLLAQAVYSAYCCAFPDSYRTFDEEFKEHLVSLVYEWVAGNRPAPRIWLSWNFEDLEPPGLKQREKLIKQSKDKKSSALNLDFLDQLTTSQMTASQSTINQIGSMSSMSSFGGAGTSRPHRKQRRTNQRSVFNGSNGTDTSRAINEVAHAQLGAEVSSGNDNTEKGPNRHNVVKNRAAAHVEGEAKGNGGEPLTPIREYDESDEQFNQQKDSKSSFVVKTPRTRVRESHPVGKGAHFTKGAFNTYGQSPLVAHFLRMKHLQVEAGLHARVKRTEIQNLPPLDSPTYRDLIQKSFKKVKDTEKKYNILAEKDREEHKKFVHKQKRELAEHRRRETALLGNRREVKRISDLIMLELKKDQDSIGAGVGLAIDAAMASLDC